MKKEHKIVAEAMLAQEKGYTHIASIVKQCFQTKYYHVVSIDSIIQAGRWIPSTVQQYGKWRGRVGTISSEIDWSTTIRRADL